jgi:hypothetical protein
MTMLRRILESERVFQRDDGLMYREHFIEAILAHGCTYCQTPLGYYDENQEFQGLYTGINLDRIKSGGKKHTSDNVCACCPLCNRVKSSEEFGFTFHEMAIIGQAIRQVRLRRGNTNARRTYRN